MNNRTYTEEELQIKILQNNDSHLFKSIDRIDQNISALNNKFDTFKYWCLSLVLGLYGLIIASFFVGK